MSVKNYLTVTVAYQQSEFTIRTEAEKVRNAIGSWQLHLNRQQLQLQIVRGASVSVVDPADYTAGWIARSLNLMDDAHRDITYRAGTLRRPARSTLRPCHHHTAASPSARTGIRYVDGRPRAKMPDLKSGTKRPPRPLAAAMSV
jgi:hypothetical protein